MPRSKHRHKTRAKSVRRPGRGLHDRAQMDNPFRRRMERFRAGLFSSDAMPGSAGYLYDLIVEAACHQVNGTISLLPASRAAVVAEYLEPLEFEMSDSDEVPPVALPHVDCYRPALLPQVICDRRARAQEATDGEADQHGGTGQSFWRRWRTVSGRNTLRAVAHPGRVCGGDGLSPQACDSVAVGRGRSGGGRTGRGQSGNRRPPGGASTALRSGMR